ICGEKRFVNDFASINLVAHFTSATEQVPYKMLAVVRVVTRTTNTISCGLRSRRTAYAIGKRNRRWPVRLAGSGRRLDVCCCGNVLVRSREVPMMRLSVLFLMIFGLGALPARAQSDGWKELFNGKDLTGWEHVGPGGFTVEDGLAKPHGGMGLLWWTGEKVGDSVIRVVFKTEKKDSNSGFFIRVPDRPTEPWMPVYRGYEVQIDNVGDDYHCTGDLYSL